MTLYPLRFKPVFKDYLWGGARMKTVLGKNTKKNPCAESWEISGVSGNISIVANGFLKGNNLQELIEIYMGDLVGDKVYERFGIEFPVLIKFIDALDDLSIQVHPNDEMAAQRHNAYGKTEMWYVMEAEANSSVIMGFNQKMNRKNFMEALREKKVKKIMNYEKVSPGDVFYIPAGRVHALGKNILLAEIQQTSDITYRIHDWERVDAKGNMRELHIELALDAIDYTQHNEYITRYKKIEQGTAELVKCHHFTTNLVTLKSPMEKDYQQLDSFVVYICTSGTCSITWGAAESMLLKKGETILLPAAIDSVRLIPAEATEILEVYI